MEVLHLLRSDPAHIGSAPLTVLGKPRDSEKTQENPGTAKRTTFDRYLLDAVNYVNEKQIAVSDLAKQAASDPGSVEAHHITIAMAKAEFSLSMAQNIIHRLTQAWNEITSNR